MLAGAARRPTTRSCSSSPPARPTRCASAATGSPPRSPTSTRRRSPPRTVSASRCSAASASPATSSTDVDVRRGRDRPARGGRRRPLRAPVRPPATSRPFDLARGPRDRPRRRRQPRGRAPAAGRRPATAGRRCARAWPAPCATRSSGASGGSGSSPTTTCSPASPRRSPTRDRRGRRAPDCASATGSCWSTSSRTPTRSSGTSSAARSATATTTLVLIGDPKQAIYAFRGADVYAYLDAARAAGDQRDAGHQLAQRPGPHRRLRRHVRRRPARPRGIEYRTVERRRRPSRAAGCTARRPTRAARPGRPARRPARDAHAAGLGVGARARASTSPTISPPTSCGCCRRTPRSIERSPTGETTGTRPRRPGHIAVLVRTHTPRRARARRARRRSACPRSSTAPAASSARRRRATGWPCSRRSSGRRRPRASTPPRSRRSSAGRAERVADGRRRGVGGRSTAACTTGRACCARRGVASLLEVDHHAERLPERVLGARRRRARAHRPAPRRPAPPPEAVDERLGATALAGWLRAPDRRGRRGRRRRGAQPAAGVRRRRRAGPDDPPQQGPRVPDRLLPVPVGHDLARRQGGRPGRLPRRRRRPRTIDVALERPAYAAHAAPYVAEERGEELRLAYVALTRARHQAVVWWASTCDSRHVAARPPAVRARGGRHRAPALRRAVRRGRGRAVPPARGEAAAGCIAVERCDPGPLTRWQRPAPPDRELSTARFDREIDRRWRRTSYSGITAAAHDPVVTSEPEARLRDDEAPDGPPAVGGRRPTRRRRCATCRRSWATCRAGRGSGRWCTPCSRRVDFAAADLEAQLQSAIGARARPPPARRRRSSRGRWRGCARSSRRRSGPRSATSGCRHRRRGPAGRAGVRAAARRRRRAERAL